MARTNKKGGNTARLKHGSPNKFLKGLGRKIGGAVSSVGQKIGGALGIGGSSGGGEMLGGGDPVAGMGQLLEKNYGEGGALFGGMGGGQANLPGAAPMMKKEGYTPYKHGMSCGCKNSCLCANRSPMKGADPTLVRGAYDAASGKGTVKYGQIAKARAFTDISKTIGATAGTLHAKRKAKKHAEMIASTKYKKAQWKKDAKFEKWKEKKGKGWKDKMRYKA